MGDLGSGNGSAFPGALDTHNNIEVNRPSANKTKARAEVPNDLAAAIIAIETELGTDPAGSLTNVKTFLQTEHSATGTHTTNTISEKTAGSGVTVDSVLLKDNTVTATTVTANTSVVTDTISEKTSAAGVTVDSCLIKDGAAAKANALTTVTQGDVTASRALATPYQNSSGYAMFITVSATSNASAAITAKSDASTPPTTVVALAQTNTGTQPDCVSFLVVPGNYYQVDVAGTPTLNNWIEWTLG